MDTIYIVAHKKCELPQIYGYIPIQVGAIDKEKIYSITDSTGENISDKNDSYCELTALYWIWKNEKNLDIVGLVHYRRFFYKHKFINSNNNIIKMNYIRKILSEYDCILPSKRKTKNLSLREEYQKYHYIKDYDMCRKIIKEKYPDYIEDFDIVSNMKEYYTFNMFIMRKDLLDLYCKWLFDILFELEKRINIDSYDNYNRRIYGFLSERLFNVWLHHNKLKIKEKTVYRTDKSFFKQEIKKII